MRWRERRRGGTRSPGSVSFFHSPQQHDAETEPLRIRPRFDLADRRFGGKTAAATPQRLLAALRPFAGNRPLGVDIPSLRPLAKRIAVPRGLGIERRQPKLLPDCA